MQKEHLMSRGFRKKVAKSIDPYLTAKDYSLNSVHTLYDLTYRKVMGKWFIFICFQASALNSNGEKGFYVRTMRLAYDRPNALEIRDAQGRYIAGSLHSGIRPDNSPLWSYASDEQLELALVEIKHQLDEHIPWLEDEANTLNYT